MKRTKIFEIDFEDYSEVDNKELLTGTLFAKYIKLGECGKKLSEGFDFTDENTAEFLKDVTRENIELLYLMKRINELEK